jgi:hypothetical protein
MRRSRRFTVNRPRTTILIVKPLKIDLGDTSLMKVRHFFTGTGHRAAWAAVFFLLVFLAGVLAPARAHAQAVRVGEKAPQFEIQGFNSEKLLGEKNILLVFYRGLF